MRVLFDDRPGRACPTGVGRYTRTLRELLRDLPGHEVVALSSLDPGFASPEEAALELPALLVREEIDLLHSPLWELPAALPCRALVTVHDAIPATHPELTSDAFQPLWRRAAREARRAGAVVCPTAHARERVVEALALDAARVHVVPEAPDPLFGPRSDEAVATTLNALGVQEPYLLVVGTVERRKNPHGVLDALAALPPERRPLTLFAGPPGDVDLQAEAAARGLEGRARGLGLVDDEALACLYTAALAVLACSHGEGFGLPVVEAWACGAPVVASTTTSLAEIAGDAALLVDPADAPAIAAAVTRCLDSAALRQDLAALGGARLAERYSPGAVREALTRVYDALSLEVTS